MKKNKKFLSIVLSVIIVILSFFMIEVSAASTGNLGTNETNITWSFDESTGILTVNGSGEMKSLNNSNGFNGKAKYIEQVVITGDIENIGSYVFGACFSLVNISIPESIIEIENNAFLNCENLKNVYYAGTEAQWNKIIFSEDGNDYLINATINFMQEEHKCTFGEWETINEPTCVSTGSQIKKCSCGREEKIVIPATGIHNFEWKISIEPSCTTNGEEKQHCVVCTETGDTRTINKLGHKKGDWEIETAATCINTGIKVRKCENCGEVLEKEIIAQSPHNFGEWKITKKESEEHDGEETRTCKSCKLVETRVIDNIHSSDRIIGDVNGDGKVMATDARVVLQVVAGLKQNSDLNFSNADVNVDNKITAVDARMILQIVAGIK